MKPKEQGTYEEFTESQILAALVSIEGVYPAWFLSAVYQSEDYHAGRKGAAAFHIYSGHMGQPFTPVLQGWVPISPMSNPHYSLSISCRLVKRTQRRRHSVECFSHFVLLLFIYQVSLAARAWYLKIEGLCESLTESVTELHCIPLLEALLRWSNRYLRNLMLQLSELFPRGKLNNF